VNILGHPYVADKSIGPLDKWLLTGSYLPDLVPFVPDSVFEFEEIHEGGERFLRFLDRHDPEKRNLALGMLTHGTKFGADKFSPDIEKRFEKNREDLAKKIAAASGISIEVARGGRFHNFLWWGVDVQILRHEKEFMERLCKVLPQINIAQTSTLLASCFEKEEPEVRRMLTYLFKPMVVENLTSVTGLARIWKEIAKGLPEHTSVTGLARIWKEIAKGLPEHDRVNIEATSTVFEDCANLLENDWRKILDRVTTEVRSNLEPL